MKRESLNKKNDSLFRKKKLESFEVEALKYQRKHSRRQQYMRKVSSAKIQSGEAKIALTDFNRPNAED